MCHMSYVRAYKMEKRSRVSKYTLYIHITVTTGWQNQYSASQWYSKVEYCKLWNHKPK